MDHNAGAQACLVREDTPLHAPGHCRLDTGAHNAAAHGFHSEGSLKNRSKGRADILRVQDHQYQGPNHIYKGHHRHQFFRNGGNSLQAAHHHQGRHDHQQDAGNPIGDPKSAVHIRGNGIDLAHIANAEAGNHAEHAEGESQDLAQGFAAPKASQAIFQVVHGTAGPLPCLILPAVVDAQNIFGVVGHHAKNRHQPHPEDGSRAAGGNGGGDTRNIAGADGGGQSRTQALELADRPVLFVRVGRHMLVLKNSPDGMPQPVAEMGHLKPAREAGHQHTGADKQHQHGNTPDEAIDFSVDRLHHFQKSTHFSFLLWYKKQEYPKGYS